MIDDSRKVNRRGGFTLLEIIVAMAIVGLGVVTLLQIFSLGLRLGARSSVETESMAYGLTSVLPLSIRLPPFAHRLSARKPIRT